MIARGTSTTERAYNGALIRSQALHAFIARVEARTFGSLGDVPGHTQHLRSAIWRHRRMLFESRAGLLELLHKLFGIDWSRDDYGAGFHARCAALCGR